MLVAWIQAVAQKWRELAGCRYMLEPELTVPVDRLNVGMKLIKEGVRSNVIIPV